MKKIKLILLTLMVSGFVSITEAQIVVTSTTASTEHAPKVVTKSIRRKGLVIRPEIGVSSTWEDDFTVNLLGNVNYQFNPYIALGGGMGFISLYEEGVPILFAVPVYANVRGYFCNRKWSPYYDIKVGYNIGSKWAQDPDYSSRKYRINGIHYDIGLGVQYKNFDFGIECVSFVWNQNGYFSVTGNYHPSEIVRCFSVGVKFAYNFQIKKKK